MNETRCATCKVVIGHLDGRWWDVAGWSWYEYPIGHNHAPNPTREEVQKEARTVGGR